MITLHTETVETDSPWGNPAGPALVGWTCDCGAEHQPPRKKHYPRGWTMHGEIAQHLIEHHGAPRINGDEDCPCGYIGHTDAALGGADGLRGRHIVWHNEWLVKEWSA